MFNCADDALWPSIGQVRRSLCYRPYLQMVFDVG